MTQDASRFKTELRDLQASMQARADKDVARLTEEQQKLKAQKNGECVDSMRGILVDEASGGDPWIALMPCILARIAIAICPG